MQGTHNALAYLRLRQYQGRLPLFTGARMSIQTAGGRWWQVKNKGAQK